MNKIYLNDQQEQAIEIIEKLQFIFGKGSFFLAVQDHQLEKEAIVTRKIKMIAEERTSHWWQRIRVHYIEQEDMFAHECLLAIKNGDKLQDDHREKLGSDQFYLKSANEMIECIF